MTEPGGASEVGAIIGYLRLNREDWIRGVHETERDSDRIGRLNPSIRISTNAGDVIGQLALVRAAERGVGTDAEKAKPFVVNLWGALAAVAPAALPIAAVAGGALIGLVPVLATVALGVSGVKAELKSGALEGTEYGRMLDGLEADAKKLQTTAAQGLLSGLDRGLAASSGLIPTVTQDVGDMSTQIGNIIAGGMPALLRILTQLNPLFVTFGNVITRGATELENWSQHSTGVSSFVAYVQAELPQVMAFLGNLVVLLSHLAQAAAPFGGVLLTDFTLLIRVLNAIPIGVLQDAIPVVVSLYVALKAYQGVNAILAGVSKAVTAMTTPFATSAAAAEASSLAVQAATAEEAAAVARAKAQEATATAESAVEIAAAVEGTSSILAAGATAAAEAAIEFAAAMQAEADAATAAAVEIGAAATAAADTVVTEGEAASIGWSAMLGPLAAVGIGLTFLLGAFTSSSSKAEEAAKIQNSYADSLRQTTNALAEVNIQTTNKNLTDDHALAQLDALKKSAGDLGITYGDLALAVNGSKSQFDSVTSTLQKLADANKGTAISSQADYESRGRQVDGYNVTGQAAVGLIAKIKGLRDGLDAQTKTQIALNEANRQAQILSDAAAGAPAGRMARELGVTTDAYVAAQLAAKKNTDQTNKQAIAFQLANDGGSLLALTLDKLSGKKLSYQQALNAFQQQLVTGGPKGTPGTPGTGNESAVAAATSRHAIAVEALAVAQAKYNAAAAKGQPTAAAHLALDRAKAAVDSANRALASAEKSGGGTPGTAADTRLRGMSAAAVQNRADILGLVQSAEQAAEAYGKVAGSSEAGRQKLIQLRAQLINSRVALGENRAEVTKWVDSLLTIPKKVPPTKLEVEKAAAQKTIDDIQARINRIKQNKEPHLSANSVEADGVIKALQDKIYVLTHPHSITFTAAGDAAIVEVAKVQAAIDKLTGGHVDIGVSGRGTAGMATGGTAARYAASGTTVFGPGTSKSDSVPYWLSVGEEVTQMPYAAGWRPLLKAINSGALGMRMPSSSPAVASRARVVPSLHTGNIAEALHGMRIVIDAGSVGTLTGFVDSRVDGTMGRAARTPAARQARADAFGRT